MSERKNIDKLFQEKFKDFEMDPPENTWPELERRLKEKEDRKIIPIWWRLGGVAAALLIGFMVGNQMGLFGGGTAVGNQVVHENTNPDPNSNGNPDMENGQKPASEAIVGAGSDSTITNQNPVAETPNDASNNVANSSDKDKNGPKKANKNNPLKNLPKAIGTEKNNAVANTQKNKKANESESDQQKSVRNLNPAETGTAVANSETKNKAGRNENPTNENHSVASAGSRPLKKSKKGTISNSEKVFGKPENQAIAQQPETDQSNSALDKKTNQAIARPQIDKENPIVNQNTTDKKSSETATVNQKTELNKDNTTHPINQVAVAEDKNQKKLDSTATAMTVPNALEELLNEKENKVTKEKEPKLNRWQLTSNVAPIYFGSTSGGSPIDSTFANNSKDYNTQMSYGLGVHYAINKKFAIRAGVNKVSLSYDTNDVLLYASLNNGGLGNVDLPPGTETLNFGRANTESRTNTASRSNEATAFGDLATDKFSGSINQKMGYIEVPLELSYAVVDKKFGVNIIAGVSTLFLSDNKIELTSEGLTTNLGEANNLNKTHFSSNIGLGLRYRFLQSFEANFEPIFKYQLNTFSKDSGDFKPYFFGLYTGVSFRF